MKAEIEILCEKLNYRFKNHELLEDALSHRSFRGNKNNERLEYLGDALLNFVIAAAFFAYFFQLKEKSTSPTGLRSLKKKK